MAVKNFVFRENQVGNKVAGMKTKSFPIFDPAWTHILTPKDPNKEFLKQYFTYERHKLYYDQFCDSQTNQLKKILENKQFLPFLTQIEQKFGPNVLQMEHFQLYLP